MCARKCNKNFVIKVHEGIFFDYYHCQMQMRGDWSLRGAVRKCTIHHLLLLTEPTANLNPTSELTDKYCTMYYCCVHLLCLLIYSLAQDVMLLMWFGSPTLAADVWWWSRVQLPNKQDGVRFFSTIGPMDVDIICDMTARIAHSDYISPMLSESDAVGHTGTCNNRSYTGLVAWFKLMAKGIRQRLYRMTPRTWHVAYTVLTTTDLSCVSTDRHCKHR